MQKFIDNSKFIYLILDFAYFVLPNFYFKLDIGTEKNASSVKTTPKVFLHVSVYTHY